MSTHPPSRISGMTTIQVKESEWVAALKNSGDVASVVAPVVLDDSAPVIFPGSCEHEWRTYVDEAMKTHGDQEWTCARCGDTTVDNPPIAAAHVEAAGDCRLR